jgi:hypothetical protein
MTEKSLNKWVSLSFFSLFIVAIFGVLMRYKIGFTFPYFNQKNLQYAHSHFAFSGWIAQTLFLLLINTLGSSLGVKRTRVYEILLGVNWIVAVGMLITFSMSGYAFNSIFFSTLSIVVALVFALLFWRDSRKISNQTVVLWYKYALFFMILSTLGTFYLMVMMGTKTVEQHAYLASVYWYLHFQYNGWFFFAGMGLLYHYFGKVSTSFAENILPVKLLGWSCIPAYGLSVLWLQLPIWLVIIFAIAALVQAIGWLLVIIQLVKQKVILKLEVLSYIKWLFVIVAIAGTAKFLLQLGSTIPAISKLAFGFRPIVIAYLHLVLLAFISLMLIVYMFMTNIARNSPRAQIGIAVFVLGIALNELLLGMQGIASLSYILIPQINYFLFGASLILLAGAALLFISQVSTNTGKH